MLENSLDLDPKSTSNIEFKLIGYDGNDKIMFELEIMSTPERMIYYMRRSAESAYKLVVNALLTISSLVLLVESIRGKNICFNISCLLLIFVRRLIMAAVSI